MGERATGHAADPVIDDGERAALELALQLRDELGGTLTAMTLGGASGERRLLDAALDAGCDAALCVVDRDEPDRTPADIDYLTAATALSRALSQTCCDILVCADRPRAEPQSLVGPAIAELLQVPHLTAVVDACVDPGDACADPGDACADPGDADSVPPGDRGEPPAYQLIVRHRGAGAVHRFRCPPPIALCVIGYHRSEHRVEDSGSRRRTGRSADGDRASPGVRTLALDELAGDARAPAPPPSVAVRSGEPGRRVVVLSDPSDLVARLAGDQLLR